MQVMKSTDEQEDVNAYAMRAYQVHTITHLVYCNDNDVMSFVVCRLFETLHSLEWTGMEP